MLVLVEDATESITSADVQMHDLLWISDGFG
jgi:hypothetical protein